MRRVKYHRGELAHDGEGAHVNDQIVITKARAALGHKYLTIAGIATLVDSVLHVPGRNKLPLLDVHGTAAERRRHDQIGLAAEKRRNLQNIHHLGHSRHVGNLMHVGEHRYVHLILDLPEDAQAFLYSRPAIAADRRAVRLVIRRFENKWEVQRTRHALDDLRHAQRVLFTLDHAGTGNEKQIAGANADVIDLER